jgi:ABC-type transporter Mla MlaB component
MAGELQRTVTIAVAGLAADIATVDALARLALVARRSACEVRLRGASPELLGLVELSGLASVLRAEEPYAESSL